MNSKKYDKSTQRERLLTGMVESVVQDGHAAASVARVIAHAGVSRPTFYDYFADRDDCFLEAHQEIAAGLLEAVRRAVVAVAPAGAVGAAARALVELVDADPVQGQFLLQGPLAGSQRLLDERDRTLGQVQRIVESACRRAPARTPTPDVSPGALIGGVSRLLAQRLSRGQRDLDGLPAQLEVWLSSYALPARRRRWGPLEPRSPPPARHPRPELALAAPPPLRRGRGGASRGEVERNQRERVLHAAVSAIAEHGYARATIADIAALAGVDRRVFYQLFKDKQEVALAAMEYCFQQMIATTASGFFGAPTWPERVWDAGRAFLRFLAANPTFATLGFVDSIAVGATAAHRTDDLRTAFTIFLQEGLQHRDPDLPQVTPVAQDAIAATIFEIAYGQIRRGQVTRLEGMLAHMTFLCLAPFLGADAANRQIDELMARSDSAAAQSRS